MNASANVALSMARNVMIGSVLLRGTAKVGFVAFWRT